MIKLNEAKFIAEIKRLADSVLSSEKIEDCHKVADGIISICNILDTDISYEEYKPQLIANNFVNESEDLFKDAISEQHISRTRGDLVASEYDS